MADSGCQCATCGNWKPRQSFSSSQLKKSTHSRTCAECVNNGWQEDLPLGSPLLPAGIVLPAAGIGLPSPGMGLHAAGMMGFGLLSAGAGLPADGAGPPAASKWDAGPPVSSATGPLIPGSSSGRACGGCKQWKPIAAYSTNQLKKAIGSSTCVACVDAGWQECPTAGQWVDPETGGTKRCYFCHKYKPNSAYSMNQRKKALQGLGTCYDCTEAGLWVGPTGTNDQRLGDAKKLCAACGNWKEADAFSASQLKNSGDAPRCTPCVNAGREVLDRFTRHDFDSRAFRPAARPPSSSSSSSSSSTSAERRRKKSRKKRRKKSSSSSRSRSPPGRPAAAAPAAAAAAAGESTEVNAAKKLVLDKLVKMKSVEPREARMKEFRSLLREWHPDKHLENTEVATAVFQFLQKAKSLVN